MLEEGAGKRDALQFSDAVADLGADFGSASDRDRGSAGIGGLKRNADEMVALLADAILRPRMQEKDFMRRKEQQLGALKRNRGSPQGLAFEVLPELIYGGAHPYGHPPTGTLETVAKISLDDVKKAKDRMLAPDRSAFIAAGEITLEEAVKLAEKHFGKWKQEAPPVPEISALDAKKRSEVVMIDKAPAPQTMLAVARPIFGRGHPDEAAMTVANEVLGGNFSSRLNMNLREQKGYTYGAYSQAAFRLGVGVFLAFAAVRQDVTAESVAEVTRELEGMRTKPPTEDEIALAKAGIILGLPGQFERASAMAAAASLLFVYGLPLDYYATLPAKYEAVVPEDVRRVAAQHLDPATMQILLVGDAKTVAPKIESLGLGKVVVRATP
jgi:zinc protease